MWFTSAPARALCVGPVGTSHAAVETRLLLDDIDVIRLGKQSDAFQAKAGFSAAHHCFSVCATKKVRHPCIRICICLCLCPLCVRVRLCVRLVPVRGQASSALCLRLL